jgi:adenylate cyclase
MTTAPLPAPGWPEVHRAPRAILVVDLVESVRQMEHDEAGVIERWRHFVHGLRSELVPVQGGRLVKSLGDGLLLDFDDVRQALACARAMQLRLQGINQAQPDAEPLMLRMGLHVAEVVVDELDIYGNAVNLASRLATLAGPHEAVASVEAVDQIVDGVDADLEDLGECFLKHLTHPVRAYRLRPPSRHGQAPHWVADTPQDSAGPATIPRARLAVLPLQAPADALALATLVADEFATLLAAHATLEVISRMSTRHAGFLAPEAVLHRVAANYAVSGQCTTSDGRLRVTLELARVAGGQLVWSRSVGSTVSAVVADPAAVLADAAGAVMSAIEAHETGRARSMPLASLDSYSLFLGGLRLMHRLSRHDFMRSRAVFDALVQRHPRHPDGYAWLAKWHILQLHQGWSPDPARSASQARDLARRALDRDDLCAVAMVVSAMVRTFNDRRLDEAEQLFEAALQVHPNEPLAWLLKGMVHAFRGEGGPAVAHTRQASALSPLDPMRYYFDSLAASAEASAGNFERAVELAQRSLQANAMHASTLRILTIAYAMLDRMEDARRVAQRLMALEPGFRVESFLARSPSSDYAIGRTFADALARAGVPP